MISVKKSYITLVELLLVICILVMMTGVLGLKIRQLVNEQRFDTEVGLVVDQLRLAQNLMLILDYDVHVKFEQLPNGEGIKYGLEVAKLLPGEWTREIARERPALKAIKKIEFRPKDQPVQTNGIDLKFFSKGSLISEGVLVLSPSERTQGNEVANSICLPGFPSAIFSVSKPMDNKDCSPQEESYEERLTTAIQRELSTKKQPETPDVKGP